MGGAVRTGAGRSPGRRELRSGALGTRVEPVDSMQEEEQQSRPGGGQRQVSKVSTEGVALSKWLKWLRK